jgi:uncharacterized membrane protein
MKRLLLCSVLLAVVVWGVFFPVRSAGAKDGAVYAVLFYSPTCLHCARLETEFLPALEKRYGNKLVIVRVNVISAAGSRIYEAALERFHVSEDRIGVPTLIVGDTFLVGTVEIPEQLPALIKSAISRGGSDWPELPGLYEQFFMQKSLHLEKLSRWQFMTYKFRQDPLANGISVFVLALMVLSLIVALVITVSSVEPPKALALLPSWTIPPLVVIGLAIAVYLSYVEVSETSAVCGPVGNCNAVQNSSYSKLFGILPVAILGMAGYLAIFAAWLFQKLGPAALRRQGWMVLWGLGFFGVLFSSYLTFLEPFVIGATCAFCLASGVVLVLILWASILPAKTALKEIRESRVS